MQGLWFRVLPAAWNHARALVPSQSKHRGPSVMQWPQLGAGSGKGQNPALALRTIAQFLWERGGSPIKRHWLAVVGGLNGLWRDVIPEVLASSRPYAICQGDCFPVRRSG